MVGVFLCQEHGVAMVPSLAQHLDGYLHIKMHLALTALDGTEKLK